MDFYNRGGECLLRGTHRDIIQNGYVWCLKR